MEILLWLVPAAVLTGIAMLWANWAGKRLDDTREPSDAARERARQKMAAALMRDSTPGRQITRPARTPDRSTGVAVRRTPTSVPRPAASQLVRSEQRAEKQSGVEATKPDQRRSA